MMAEHGNSQELSEEQKLQLQLQQVSLDYQNLVNQSREMAPKGTGSKKINLTAGNSIDDDDLEGMFNIKPFTPNEKLIQLLLISITIEIASVADNLDSLESALDVIEERADRIREQLLELLTSNREIRQSIREENDKMRECEQTKEQTDENSPSTPANNESNNP